MLDVYPFTLKYKNNPLLNFLLLLKGKFPGQKITNLVLDLTVGMIFCTLVKLRSSVAPVVAIECVSYRVTPVYILHSEDNLLELKTNH